MQRLTKITFQLDCFVSFHFLPTLFFFFNFLQPFFKGFPPKFLHVPIDVCRCVFVDTIEQNVNLFFSIHIYPPKIIIIVTTAHHQARNNSACPTTANPPLCFSSVVLRMLLSSCCIRGNGNCPLLPCSIGIYSTSSRNGNRLISSYIFQPPSRRACASSETSFSFSFSADTILHISQSLNSSGCRILAYSVDSAIRTFGANSLRVSHPATSRFFLINLTSTRGASLLGAVAFNRGIFSPFYLYF